MIEMKIDDLFLKACSQVYADRVVDAEDDRDDG